MDITSVLALIFGGKPVLSLCTDNSKSLHDVKSFLMTGNGPQMSCRVTMYSIAWIWEQNTQRYI